ncbi:MAG: 5-oxoprolinase subunit PxpB [Burkholderiaceae bacterium]|nr:5-oxoprolinase subunit PxpB [Burkholderiaceae bacterium]
MISTDGLIISGDVDSPWSIGPQGDRTLLLIHESDGVPDVNVGRTCAHIAQILRAANIPGISDIVPAFNTVALHFKPRLFGPSPNFKNLAIQVQKILASADQAADTQATARTIDIPVCYGGDYGPDLEDVARHCGLIQAEVIALHSSVSAYVFMLGFAPGAPYVGIHDQRLDIGRRSTPRLALPRGSVAMANRQTIIYPNVSPGGWHVIGATPISLFNPEAEPSTLLQAGDMVRFIPITAAEYLALQAQPL